MWRADQRRKAQALGQGRADPEREHTDGRDQRRLSFRYEHADIDVRARRQDIPPQFVEIEYEVRLPTAAYPPQS